jgi:transcriptional regulator with XRE-family HTH domain
METMIDKDDVRLRKHLKRFIQERMRQLNLSQADLARLTGDGTNQIYRAVNGLNTPSLAFALRLASALQCTIEEFSGTTHLVESE